MRKIGYSAVLLVALVATLGCRKQPGSAPVLIQPVGNEFEVHALGNDDDDAEAIDAARELFAKAATDEKVRDQMGRFAIERKPPPPPKPEPGLDFVVNGVGASYRWAPLSDYRLRAVGLEPSYTPGSAGEALFNRLAEARKTGACEIVDGATQEGRRLATVWWSRERIDARTVEYFQLVRLEPEESQIRAEEITIEYLRGDKLNDQFVIWGRLDPVGTDKFAELTRRNNPPRPAGATTIRSLAMLVNGQIVIAPTLNDVITNGRFVINLSDDQKEADDLIAALQVR